MFIFVDNMGSIPLINTLDPILLCDVDQPETRVPMYEGEIQYVAVPFTDVT